MGEGRTAERSCAAALAIVALWAPDLHSKGDEEMSCTEVPYNLLDINQLSIKSVDSEMPNLVNAVLESSTIFPYSTVMYTSKDSESRIGTHKNVYRHQKG